MTKFDPNAPATMGYVHEAINTIVDAVGRMFNHQNEILDKRFNQIDENFERLEDRINMVEKNIKDDIDGLKGELALTVTKKELYKLSKRKTLN
jgi:hypothetical protein